MAEPGLTPESTDPKSSSLFCTVDLGFEFRVFFCFFCCCFLFLTHTAFYVLVFSFNTNNDPTIKSSFY